jgi:hypothetical protein
LVGVVAAEGELKSCEQWPRFDKVGVMSGDNAGRLYEDHPLRDSVLQEIHSRPFHPLTTPAQLLHFAFTADFARSDFFSLTY